MIFSCFRETFSSLALLLLSVHAAACAQAPARVKISPNSCAAASSAQKSWLPAEWKPFLPFVKVCAVRQPGAKPALLLTSVFAVDYYKAQPGNDLPQVQM